MQTKEGMSFFMLSINKKHKVALKLREAVRQQQKQISGHQVPLVQTLVQTLLAKHYHYILTFLRFQNQKMYKANKASSCKLQQLFKSPTSYFLYVFVLWALYFSSTKLFFHKKSISTANSVSTLNYIRRNQVKPATVIFKKNYKQWKKQGKFTSKPLLLEARANRKYTERVKQNIAPKSKHLFILTVFLLSFANSKKKNANEFEHPNNTPTMQKRRIVTKAIFILYQQMSSYLFCF